LFNAVASGALKVHVFKEYPFTAEGVGEAQATLASGKTTGKLIIKVSE
jgi:NADPH2:quinone reductase